MSRNKRITSNEPTSGAAPSGVVEVPHSRADAGMAREYQDWIDFWHAGSGDYADFLRKRLPAEDGVLVDAPRPRCKPGACPMPTVCGERCSRQDRAAGVKACSVNRFTSRVCERGTQGCTVAHGVLVDAKEKP